MCVLLVLVLQNAEGKEDFKLCNGIVQFKIPFNLTFCWLKVKLAFVSHENSLVQEKVAVSWNVQSPVVAWSVM